MRAAPARNMKPPHRARFRSNGFHAEKCCAGVNLIGNAEAVASCHQSSSSTRRRPDDRTSAAFPKGVTTTGLKRRASMLSVRRSRSEEHTSELQSRQYLVCRLLLEKKKTLNGTVAYPQAASCNRFSG